MGSGTYDFVISKKPIAMTGANWDKIHNAVVIHVKNGYQFTHMVNKS